MTDTRRGRERTRVAFDEAEGEGEEGEETPIARDRDSGTTVEMQGEQPTEVTIPIADPSIGSRERRTVGNVLDSRDLTDGEVVATFEKAFSSYCGVEHGVATANGTTALHAGLEAVEIGHGDRVLTTPFSSVATANAVRLAGADVVFADVDPETSVLDPAAVERRIEDLDGDVDAILAVHLYGLPAPMAELREIADAHDAVLIEDAAQAHGGAYRGAPVGSLGDLACFSFSPTANMTTGDGGMVVTDRTDVERGLRRFVDHGRDPSDPGVHDTVGHNFRMPNVAAAIGTVQLEMLDGFVEHRRRNAEILHDRLAALPVETPVEPAGTTHAYNRYTIRCADRDALQATLEEFGVGTGRYYDTPIPRQPSYADVERSFPRAERAANEVLSLPVHPELATRDVSTVATAVEYHYDHA